MFIVRILACLMLLLSPLSNAGAADCRRDDAACTTACSKLAGVGGLWDCLKACHAKNNACLGKPATTTNPITSNATTNAAMPPPRGVAQQVTQPATPKPGVNWVTRPRELADSGVCRANATACRGSCEGATANPGSAAGFKHMECVSQCVVTQAQCGQLAADVERGVRLPNGKCADGSNGLCFHTNK